MRSAKFRIVPTSTVNEVPMISIQFVKEGIEDALKDKHPQVVLESILALLENAKRTLALPQPPETPYAIANYFGPELDDGELENRDFKNVKRLN